MSVELDKIISLVGPVIVEEGCELWDVEVTSEMGDRILRVFIEKQGGVQVGDCSRVSHAIEDLLEVENVVTGRYRLEVSSPGLNRVLSRKEHFERFLGQTVEVTTKEKLDGRRHYKGVLKAVMGEELVIGIDHQTYSLPLTSLLKANLVWEPLKNRW